MDNSSAGLLTDMLPILATFLGVAGWWVVAGGFVASVVAAFGLGRLTAGRLATRTRDWSASVPGDRD